MQERFITSKVCNNFCVVFVLIGYLIFCRLLGSFTAAHHRTTHMSRRFVVLCCHRSGAPTKW